MATVSLAASATSCLSSDLREIKDLSKVVEYLQIRADLIGEVDTNKLRSYYSGKLLYSLRSRDAGGAFEGSPIERRARLIAASKSYDLLELESDRDLSEEVLAAVPAHRRLLFWRGSAPTLAQLRSAFAGLALTSARFYGLCSVCSRSSDGLAPLLLLQQLGRNDVAAHCEGAAGQWSTLLAPHFGSPLAIGLLEPQTGATAPLSVEQLAQDYGFPALHPLREVYGIVGNRISQSLSPRLHNTGYRTLGHPAIFLPFHVEDFQEFWREMVESRALGSLGLPIRGLTVVSPHKEAALAAADTHSPMVRKARSSNLFVRKDGRWEAHSTDSESVPGMHRRAPHGAQLKAAVVGCGGAGRAVAAALHLEGADVTLVNRGEERGRHAVRLLGLPFVPLSDFQAGDFTLLVNATPVGQDGNSIPFAIDSIGPATVVVDLAYGKRPTYLVSCAVARGSTVIDGHDVAITQVRRQFQMMVGSDLPLAIGRNTLVSRDLLWPASAAPPAPGGWHAQEAFECSF
jgi:3-dehydroquinate dehydratase/shikimate dehydrogenase